MAKCFLDGHIWPSRKFGQTLPGKPPRRRRRRRRRRHRRRRRRRSFVRSSFVLDLVFCKFPSNFQLWLLAATQAVPLKAAPALHSQPEAPKQTAAMAAARRSACLSSCPAKAPVSDTVGWRISKQNKKKTTKNRTKQTKQLQSELKQSALTKCTKF